MTRLDPDGKRALFEAPVTADHRALLRPGQAPDGKAALFSTGPRQAGTVVVDCGGCGERRRVSLLDLGTRLATLSVWLPNRRRPHWMRCPACGRHSWCRVDWNS